MSRLCRLCLFVVCLSGAATPTLTEAGCCGTGGSTYGAGYAPYSTGYTPYYTSYAPYSAGYSSYYTGYSSYYSPYATGYSAGIGCSSCQSCNNCSPCSGGNCGTGCASGNCGVGCTANSVPTGGLQPIADPANGTARNIENRLEVIERELRITPPRARTYAPDNFNSASPNRNRNNDAPSPTRNREDGTNFEAPAPGRNREENDNEMFRERSSNGSTERSFKPATERIAIPGNDDSTGTVIQSKKPAPGPSIDDKNDTTLRLDSRITSRAVAPRGRQFMVSGATAVTPVVAKTKPQLQVDAQPRTINLARQ
ncbi:MAG TPA: hypothetical protein VGM98_12320 [Schlesneria sp.]